MPEGPNSTKVWWLSRQAEKPQQFNKRIHPTFSRLLQVPGCILASRMPLAFQELWGIQSWLHQQVPPLGHSHLTSPDAAGWDAHWVAVLGAFWAPAVVLAEKRTTGRNLGGGERVWVQRWSAPTLLLHRLHPRLGFSLADGDWMRWPPN